MSNQIVVKDEDYFAKAQAKDLSKIKAVAVETFQRDREDFLEELAETLNIETSELPTVSVELLVHFGKSTVSVPAFEESEDDEDEEDSDE